MKQYLLLISIFSYLNGFSQLIPNYNHLVWSDECNGNGALDSTKWFHQTQLPQGGSWYNGEIQHYTNQISNSFYNNGFMVIVAKKENFTDQGVTKQFTSARLNSKFAFTYGKVEMRAKLPTGVGTWPAFWMLGKNISEPGAFWQTQGFGTTPWPACGEIDILEHWGNNQNFVQSAIHSPSSFGGTVNHGGRLIPTASTAFHVYSMTWTPDLIQFSIDGIVHYTYNPPIKNAQTWPFNQDQYLLLNIAIEPSIHPNFQQTAMEIDYVRVYQLRPTSVINMPEIAIKSCFPNPVHDELNIQLMENCDSQLSVKIYQIDGKIIKQFTLNAEKGLIKINNLSILNAGIYWAEMEKNGKKIITKFVKH